MPLTTGPEMPWANDYMRVPFVDLGRSRAGVDCWGLIYLALTEQAGAAVPLFLDEYENTADREYISALIERKRQSAPFRPVAPRRPDEKAQAYIRRLAPLVRPLDVLLLPMVGELCHVGIAFGAGRFLHAEVGRGVLNNTFDPTREQGERWALRLAAGGAYRHVKLADPAP